MNNGGLFYYDFFRRDYFDESHILRVRIFGDEMADTEIYFDRYNINELPEYTLVFFKGVIKKVKTADLPGLLKKYGNLDFASEPEYNEYIKKQGGADNGKVL